MNKSFKIEVDCANCANLVESAVKENRRSKGRIHILYDAEDENRL